jgi:hypothetical protein
MVIGKNLLNIVLFLLLCFLPTVYTNDREIQRFYRKVVEENFSPTEVSSLEYKNDQQGLYLGFNQYYDKDTQIAMINKKYVLSGCDFFPFKDILSRYFLEFAKINGFPDINGFIDKFHLVYYMLFIRFGNKERIAEFYQRIYKTEIHTEFYDFFIIKEKKDYLKIIELSARSASAFNFSKEDLKLARDFNFILKSFDLINELHEYVLAQVKSMKDSKMKNLLLPIVSDKDKFYLYTDWTTKAAIIKSKQYREVLSEQSQQDYDLFNKELANLYSSNECHTLIPLIDLLRHNENYKYKLNIKSLPYSGYEFSLDSDILANTMFTFNRLDSTFTDEDLLINFGIMSKKPSENFYINFVFEKNKFPPVKSNACVQFGCGGFNINAFFNQNQNKVNYLFWVGSDINHQLLNILKIIAIPEKKLDNLSLVTKLQQFSKLENEIELKAIFSYINLLKQSNNLNTVAIYLMFRKS